MSWVSFCAFYGQVNYSRIWDRVSNPKRPTILSFFLAFFYSTANTTIATASIRILVGYRQFKNCIQQCILTFTFGPLKISCVTYDLGWDSIFMTDQKTLLLHTAQSTVVWNDGKILFCKTSVKSFDLLVQKKLAWKSSQVLLEPERQRLMTKVAWNFAL